MDYIKEFLSLKCSGDVLNACSPIGHNVDKEISEALAIIKKLKNITIKNKNCYNVVDLCSGNALIPVIAAHLLPITNSIAIDKSERKRHWEQVRNFQYLNININDKEIYNFINSNTIITACHPCCNLANRIIEIYQNSLAAGIVMMPCCSGRLTKYFPPIIEKKLGKYFMWCWQLAEKIDGKLIFDENVLSPKNGIITHFRGENNE